MKFQSLIGRLQTLGIVVTKLLEEMFQSLIGRLQTRLIGRFDDVVQGFNPS